jgi:hypothetical protein
MENIGRGPTFEDFVTILKERSMQKVTVARFQIIFMANAITRKIVQCYFVHRVVTLYSVHFELTRVIPTDLTKGESALYISY